MYYVCLIAMAAFFSTFFWAVARSNNYNSEES